MMRTRGLGLTTVLVLGAALCNLLTLAACSLLEPTHTRSQGPARATTSATDLRLKQLDFGREARFALCVDPACPAVTRKTLAAAAPGLAPSAAIDQPAPQTVAATPWVEPKPASTPAPVSSQHKVVLHFATNSAALTAAHKSLLRGSIAELRQTDRLVIVGRTDNVGSDARNQSIALARALAIRDHLLDLAPDLPARIAIDAKGRCCYTVPNETPDGRAQNRRVELVFTLPNEVKP